MSKKPSRVSLDGALLMSMGACLFGLIVTWLKASQCEFSVYDNGEDLVIKQSGRTAAIPFTNIVRVVYRPQSMEQWVWLQLKEPCIFGDQLEFRISCQLAPDAHSEMADDLHRRSRCCKTGKDGTEISAH